MGDSLVRAYLAIVGRLDGQSATATTMLCSFVLAQTLSVLSRRKCPTDPSFFLRTYLLMLLCTTALLVSAVSIQACGIKHLYLFPLGALFMTILWFPERLLLLAYMVAADMPGAKGYRLAKAFVIAVTFLDIVMIAQGFTTAAYNEELRHRIFGLNR